METSKNLTCEKCDRTFAAERNLKHHRQSTCRQDVATQRHKKPKNYKIPCELCCALFLTPKNLKQHYRDAHRNSHSNEITETNAVDGNGLQANVDKNVKENEESVKKTVHPRTNQK